MNATLLEFGEVVDAPAESPMEMSPSGEVRSHGGRRKDEEEVDRARRHAKHKEAERPEKH